MPDNVRLTLQDGAKIAVIGAGPAGSFFAHFARQLARARGISVSITIFDAKSFLKGGPPGCNMCAGVVPDGVVRDLARAGIVLPPQKVQREIEGYLFHAPGGRLGFTDVKREEHIYAVFRGNGPRFADSHDQVSFDDFLLRHVEGEGVTVVTEPVFGIQLPKDPRDPVVIHYGRPPVVSTLAADLVVGAFGLNTRMVEQVEALGFGYRSPQSVRAFQAELPLGSDDIRRFIGNNIHIFCLGHSNLRFGAFVPKRDFLTVSLVGRRDVGAAEFHWFLSQREVRRALPPGWELPRLYCWCHPKLPVSPGRNPYTNRLVMVGDASWSKYYKNGIGSAFLTARLAAWTAFMKGVGEQDFRDRYERECARRIVRDNRYGMTMFRANDVISRARWQMGLLARIASPDRSPSVQAPIHRVYWGMFTGGESYRSLFALALKPDVQLPLALSAVVSAGTGIAAAARRVAARLRGSAWLAPAVWRVPGTTQGSGFRVQGSSWLGPLRDGSTVAILGGGPAGTACAIALKKLARERQISLDVVLYEGKVFAGEKQYNQCAGVLSPPIEALLESGLGIPFPHSLVQRKVRDYHLYGSARHVVLKGEDVSLALRRVLFDDYLMAQARAYGVGVVHSRVSDLEFGPQGVMVYSESDNRRVDVLVGAFGVDEGAASVFERTTPYRRPNCLHTVVTKIHPGMDFMARFREEIFAFLPMPVETEYGAIIPKYNHLTVIIGGRRVTHESMNRFLAMPQVRRLLPEDFSPEKHGLKYFKGRYPTSLARGLYGDRYVTIGDASGLMRPFKGKGVTAAISTGIKAANAMLTYGISKEAFAAYYRQCRDVTGDIPYGRAVRWAAVLGARLGLLPSVIGLSDSDPKLRDALFACASGSKPYRQVCAETLSLNLCLRIAQAAVRDRVRQWFGRPG